MPSTHKQPADDDKKRRKRVARQAQFTLQRAFADALAGQVVGAIGAGDGGVGGIPDRVVDTDRDPREVGAAVAQHAFEP